MEAQECYCPDPSKWVQGTSVPELIKCKFLDTIPDLLNQIYAVGYLDPSKRST